MEYRARAAPYPGSHASKLIAVIRRGHEGVKLSRGEFTTLVTWVDANAPYYGSYFGRRNLRYKDHPNFRPVPTDMDTCGFVPCLHTSRECSKQ